ncbi:protein lifeguard 3-like isoform X1 [Portunus trituberculatus]|uniref:protein lifeguard 3-like isoform X1 n=1 Tax=Portunus trituberculatus TaxID=210409 RepID=UPI001E1D04E6|nr:protein lifeguard 3-like isoform X1 [Portunus trituberculatus]XP_045110150.1 protein lifeguard 3-like isoform X1 [Portunus trituberculatus]XP_045110154.1 protein lifeguard 3-like isoform X1 [Portunus trituberculatus]XP_045110155.1 protein lifeguard 3-like isoform X1 [Portunus trituberculatus]
MSAPYPVNPTAPYPGDPSKSPAGNAGWTMPNAPPGSYPVQPGFTNPGYNPQAPYPVQPVSPAQPGAAFPVEPPPPYSAQQGFVGQPGPYAQPVYNASSGDFPVQDGNRGREEVPKDMVPNQFGASFSDKAVRHAFIRKVYLILMVQLLITFLIVSLFTFHTGTKMFVRRNVWVYYMSYVVFLVTYISMVCCSGVRRKWPGNFIMLGIFTLALSYVTGTIASFYETSIVIMTIGITCAICFLITLFATQTKYDFTGCGIYLFVAAMVMFIFGIIAIFTYSRILYTIYSAGIALLFSMYMVYDTQMIVGGRKHEMSPEEHIYGALLLYLDIIHIFLALLSIFGGRD